MDLVLMFRTMLLYKNKFSFESCIEFEPLDVFNPAAYESLSSI